MGIFAKYPYTDFTNLNLDWILQRMKEVEAELQRYLDNSVITFADPITWDITEQYTALTVVVDSDGTAYLSKQPVPSGISIDNTNYWLPIFNYDDNINTLRSQIAYNARTSATTGQALNVGDLVFWNGLLYHVLTPMAAGTAFIDGTNIEPYTVDEKINNIDITGQIEPYIDDIRDTIAYDAHTDPYTSVPLAVGDLVYSNGLLYEVIADMPAGTAFIIGTNIELKTVSERIAEIKTDITTEIADRIAADTSLQNQIDAIATTSIYVNPDEYGAVGDGVTDDIEAFEAAIATGRPLYIPDKTYLISRPLFIAQDVFSHGRIIGTNTIDVSDVDTGVYGGYALIYLTGTDQNVFGLHVEQENINSYWNGSGGSGASEYGGIIVHGKNATLDNIYTNVYLWGVLILSPDGGHMTLKNSRLIGGIAFINEVFNDASSKPYEAVTCVNVHFTGNLSVGTGDSDSTTFIGCTVDTFSASTQFLVRVARNDAQIPVIYTHPVFIECKFYDNKAHSVGNYSCYISGYNPTDPGNFGDVGADFINCTYEIVNNYTTDSIAIDAAEKVTFRNCKIKARINTPAVRSSDDVFVSCYDCDFVAKSASTPIIYGSVLMLQAFNCHFSDEGTNTSTDGYILGKNVYVEGCQFKDSYRAPLQVSGSYCNLGIGINNETDYTALAQLGTTAYKFFGQHNRASGGANALDASKIYPPIANANSGRLYGMKAGDLFYDLTGNKIYGYNGSAWVQT